MHDLVERYALARDVRPGSLGQLEYALKSFSEFLGRSIRREDFCDDTVNRFIVWLASKKYAHETIRTRRNGILAIWRAEADEGRADQPRRIRRLAPHVSIPQAWLPDQLDKILAQCDKLKGTFRSAPTVERRLFGKAYSLVSYETGFRRSDVLRIRRPQITDAGLIVLVQSKTTTPHLARIRPETIAAIDAMGTAGRETVFGGILSLRRLGRFFDEIRTAAGVPKGSLKWFRRSGATHVEAAHPGQGWIFLGHTSPRVAKASYLDPTQTGQEPLLPPKIG